MPNTTIDKITDDITSLFKSAAEKIKNANATPIFSTICPMSLDTWNHRRPSQHRTSHLSSFPYYPLMQEKHESVILKINQEIHLLNKSHNMHTPDLPSPWYITPRASWDADMEGLWTACIPTITWRTNGSTHSTGSWTSIEVPQISYHQQNQRNHSLRMRNMTVTALPNEAGSTDDADYVCEWMDCPDIPLPFQLADLCRLIQSVGV